MTQAFSALSIKQPWAALIVHGLKTVEVRGWGTRLRGVVLIHASGTADERPQVWEGLPAEVSATAQLRGGLIGAAELVDCVSYRNRDAFAADRPRHWNRPEWFREPVAYGLVFERPRVLPFRRVKGWFKFFRVELKARELRAVSDASRKRR